MASLTNKIAGSSLDFGNIRGKGFLGFESSPGRLVEGFLPFRNLGIVVSVIVGILTLVAIIWMLIKLITGSLGILNSGGDKSKLSQARNDITFALIGFVVIVSALFLVKLVGTIIGYDILNMDQIWMSFRDLIPS